jgi:hypothetical protein
MAMTKTEDIQTRKRTLRFSDPLSTDELEALRPALLQMKGIIKIDGDEQQLSIEYAFPTCHFGEIWQLISELIGSSHITFIDRLHHSLLGFAEQNERDHRLYPRHWHSYTEDIYVHYFDYHHDNITHAGKQLWRRYKRNP